MSILPSALIPGQWYVRSPIGRTLYRGTFEACEDFIDSQKGTAK